MAGNTSGLKDQLFNVEKLDALIVADRILYGSMYPLFCLKSTLLEVTKAEIDVESRNKILFSNSINIFRK
jgi:predicted TIM-barrel fold metal-dependent hydrolase